MQVAPEKQLARSCTVVAAAFALACNGGNSFSRLKLEASVRDSAGFKILALNQSPSDVSRGRSPADTLRPNLDLASSGEGFQLVSDVATFRDGRIAVLDGATPAVFLFSQTGQLLARIGRKGDGPGEFRAPIALTVVGQRLVLLQARLVNTVEVLDSHGRAEDAISRSVPGDWMRMVTRAPATPPIDGGRVSRTISEDPTRRLGSSGDTAFVLQQQAEEDLALTRPTQPQAALLRFDTHAQLLDTIAVVHGVPILPGKPPFAGAAIQPVAPMFFARSVWTLGAGWIALGYGRDTALLVRDPAGVPLLGIRWPRTLRTRVSTADQITWTRWALEYEAATAGEHGRAAMAAMPKRYVERRIQEFARTIPFSDSAPELMAGYPAGDCLWLAGYSVDDYIDGTSLTWVGIDVRRARLLGAIRIPRRGGRVRHFDATGVYVSYRDSLGLAHLERYSWGSHECETQASD